MTLKTTFHTHVGIIVEFTIVITSRRRWAADDRSRSRLWVTVYPFGRSFVVATAATLRTRANPELLEEQAAPEAASEDDQAEVEVTIPAPGPRGSGFFYGASSTR